MLVNIRETLKKIPWLYSLNAFIKARNNTSNLRALYKYYQEIVDNGVVYSEDNAVRQVRERFAERGIYPESMPRNRLRIFWVGAHYAQDNSGFLQALRQFGEVITFTNASGKYGLEWAASAGRRPSCPEVVDGNSRFLLDQVKAAHKKSPLHLLIGQMWANVIDAGALVEIQRMGIPTINISMDDKLPELWGHYQGRRMGSIGLSKGLDLVLTTSPDTCCWYQVEGCHAIYWPLASDPELFYPRSNKIYDVVFVGGKYGSRGKLVKKLISAGIDVEAFGPGWPNGYIDAQKISEVFGKSKIILGSGYVGYNKDILTIKLRDFDATMSGALYITNRNPDLLKLFDEGTEIECYDSIKECIEKIGFYLTNPERLKSIARAGHAKAKARYSWNEQIGKALHAVGFCR